MTSRPARRQGRDEGTGGLRESVVRQTPLGRLGTPRDTASLVEFLCSPEGGWINGQLLTSNGGLS